MAIFEAKEQVRYLDLDKNNKMTNKAIINLMQDVAGAHSEKLQDGLNYKDKNHTAWILLNWKVEVFSRPKYLDFVTVKTWPRKLDKCCCYRDFELYSNEKLVAKATSKWVLINSELGKISKVSQELLDKYASVDTSVFDQEIEEKLKEPGNSKLSFEIEIGRTRIDTNNHLNNVYYLDYAIESLPEEVYENNEFNNLEIMYKKASRYKDKIMCYYKEEDGKHFVTIKDNQKNIHAIVKMW